MIYPEFGGRLRSIQQLLNFEKQSFEAWNNSVSDSDYEKLKDAMVLLIEKAIVDEGNEDWKNVIPAPYDTNMVKASVQKF